MDFEGHQFDDRAALREALRASWPGVWVEPRDGTSDPMPFTWAVRFGELEPSWRDDVALACAELLLDGDDDIAFAALDALRSAPWDVGPVVAGFAADHASELGARTSPRQKGRRMLADVAELLLLSSGVGKGGAPSELSTALAEVGDAPRGFPETALVAIIVGGKGRAKAIGRLVDALSNAGDAAPLVDRVLGLGEPVSELVLRAIGAHDAALAQRVGDAVKARLETAAAGVEKGLANPDYPAAVKAKLKAARGSHAKRWKAAAALLGVPAGKFEA
ncbi:MAG: hypothetical protein KC635_22825 [Myxococcales bacterium]|nr:hypothetical protein [Myxococcales bacterium]